MPFYNDSSCDKIVYKALVHPQSSKSVCNRLQQNGFVLVVDSRSREKGVMLLWFLVELITRLGNLIFASFFFVSCTGDFNSDNEIKNTLEADNYEDQLKEPEMDEDEQRRQFAKCKFIDYIGTDKMGQPIIAIYACRLPSFTNTHSFIK